MRWMFPVIVAAWCAMPAAQAGTGHGSGLEDKRMHVETTFKVVVHAPYAETAELFGPEGERAWAGKHWVVTQHDVDARHFQYVYFIPNMLVTTIDVRFQSLDSKSTQVTVTYARTAISPEGDEHVKTMSDGDQTAGMDWQEAIDMYLASRTPTQVR